MRRTFLWIQLVLAAIVAVGVWLQVYFIASYFFGAEDALDAHEFVGGVVVHGGEVLGFLAALVAWWRVWSRIGFAFGLALLGTVQIVLSGDDWVGGFHGLLALAVLVMAVFIMKWNAEALGLRRGHAEPAGGDMPPPPP